MVITGGLIFCAVDRQLSKCTENVSVNNRKINQSIYIYIAAGQEGYVKNILGLFDGSLKMPSYQESTDDRLLFVEETYTSGTFCDLEEYREPRMTSVRVLY